MKLTFLLALGIVGAMVCGCSALGRTVFEFRVTYAETGEPVVGACVSTERISDRSPAPEAQGNSDSDGSVTAVHWFVLNPLTRQPHRSPMLVRIDGPEAHEKTEGQRDKSATCTGKMPVPPKTVQPRIITLIKPHYEVHPDEKKTLLTGGALEVADSEMILQRVLKNMPSLGVEVLAQVTSPITGKKSSKARRGAGNVEYLALLQPHSS